MLIEFGILNYKIIIPFIYPFLFQIRRWIHKESSPFYELFTTYLGHLLGGIAFWFIKFRMRKQKIPKTQNEKGKEKLNEQENISTNDKKNEKNDPRTFTEIPKRNISFNLQTSFIVKEIQINTKNRSRHIIALALIYIAPLLLESFTHQSDSIIKEIRLQFYLFFVIFFYVLLSIILLGYKNYKHQRFALAIIMCCIPFLLILYFLNSNKDEDNKDDSLKILNTILYLIVIAFLYAFYDVMNKKYLNHYTDSPYCLMLNIGIISLFILIPYELISLIFSKGKECTYNGIYYQIKENINNLHYYPLIFIADVLSAFLWIGGIQLTIYFFSPCHFIISESLSQIIATFIEKTFDNYGIQTKILIGIIYGIVVFAGLIYNEIIIINMCSLSVNTRKKIMNRETKENFLALRGQIIDEDDEEDKDSSRASLNSDS